jgi:hypothetical protein|tara:strand:- start:95 stop:328 length:234 start_codon:yes stop_codon:yes gene_type:complete
VLGLLVPEDYLEGTRYSAGGTDGLTLDTPATFVGLNDGNNIINHDYSLAFADFYTRTTGIAFFKIYIGHFCHFDPPY